MRQKSGRLSQLSAQQAAARLGIKVETLYAYVSRGVIERRPGRDGRKSLFDAREVERLARGRRGGPRTGGLSVVLGTGLTSIENERVCYRGLDAGLLSTGAPFERVAEWLWLPRGRCRGRGCTGSQQLKRRGRQSAKKDKQ